jgi:hypothetical protein
MLNKAVSVSINSDLPTGEERWRCWYVTVSFMDRGPVCHRNQVLGIKYASKVKLLETVSRTACN